MSKLKRYYIDGSYYFVTIVTHQRTPILVDLADDLIATLRRLKQTIGFTVHAWVIMPDHLHMILEPAESNLADIIKRFKLSVAYTHRKQFQMRSGKTWQARFWDHAIRDERDMYNHLEYIQNNPIKHGYVSSIEDWKLSSTNMTI